MTQDPQDIETGELEQPTREKVEGEIADVDDEIEQALKVARWEDTFHNPIRIIETSDQ